PGLRGGLGCGNARRATCRRSTSGSVHDVGVEVELCGQLKQVACQMLTKWRRWNGPTRNDRTSSGLCCPDNPEVRRPATPEPNPPATRHTSCLIRQFLPNTRNRGIG